MTELEQLRQEVGELRREMGELQENQEFLLAALNDKSLIGRKRLNQRQGAVLMVLENTDGSLRELAKELDTRKMRVPWKRAPATFTKCLYVYKFNRKLSKLKCDVSGQLRKLGYDLAPYKEGAEIAT
jgi:hypothetical protein